MKINLVDGDYYYLNGKQMMVSEHLRLKKELAKLVECIEEIENDKIKAIHRLEKENKELKAKIAELQNNTKKYTLVKKGIRGEVNHFGQSIVLTWTGTREEGKSIMLNDYILYEDDVTID